MDKNVLYYLKPIVNQFSNGREIVFFGKNDELMLELKNNGITAEKIFTGNKELLSKNNSSIYPKNELKGNKSLYYVVIPFFIGDGSTQRNELKEYGYEEFVDYIFVYTNKQFDNVKKYNEIFDAIDVLKQKVENLEIITKTNDEKMYQILWQCYREKGESDLEARKRFFRSIPKAKGINRALQLAAIILMNKFHKTCMENNIVYWLDFGCLLGAVRHGGFIPWDDDIDVCMPRIEINKLKEALDGDPNFFIDDRFFMTPNGIHHTVQLKFVESKIMKASYCLDIFVYDYTELDDSMETWNLYKEIKNRFVNESLLVKEKSQDVYRQVFMKYKEEFDKVLCTSLVPTETLIWAVDNFTYWQSPNGIIKSSDIFPLVEVPFEENMYYAPHDSENFISKKYDNIYDMPDDMFTHQHFVRSDEQEKGLKIILKKYGLVYPK